MKRCLAILFGIFLFAPIVHAQEISETYYSGTVVSSTQETIRDFDGTELPRQMLRVRVDNGSAKPPEIEITNEGDPASGDYHLRQTGEHVILLRQDDGTKTDYIIFDHDRRWPLIGLAVMFVLLSIVFAGKRGVFALLGCAVSLAVLVWFIVPQLLSGADAFSVSLVGCILIAALSLVLAHGWNKRTAIAFAGTVTTLLLVALLSKLAVFATGLTGMGSEESLLFRLGPLGNLDLRGLLLAGILIGTLGVLDDVTTAQSAAVAELKDANAAFGFKELYRRASSIGREHIASLVNTLVLAYVGVSLPLFLLLTTSSSLPWWVSLNSEFLAEEIVRTLVGSMGLILAVPITTAMAAWFFSKKR